MDNDRLPDTWAGLRDFCLAETVGDLAKALELSCRIAVGIRESCSRGYVRARPIAPPAMPPKAPPPHIAAGLTGDGK